MVSAAPDLIGEEADLDLRGLLEALRRQLMVVVFAVVALGFLGVVAMLLQRPVFSATALVMVDTSRKDLLSGDSALAADPDSARVDSEVELVASEPALRAVAADLGLAGDAEFAPHTGLWDIFAALLHLGGFPPTGSQAQQGVVDRLAEAVNVKRRAQTYLIAVEARSGDPQKSAAIANSLARTYIAGQLEAKIDAILAARDTLSERLAQASAGLAASDSAFDTFILDNIGSIGAQTGRLDLVGLASAIQSSLEQRTQLATDTDLAGTLLQHGDFAGLASALHDAGLADLVMRRQTLAASLAATATDAQPPIEAELAVLVTQIEALARAGIDGLNQQSIAAQADIAEKRAALRSGVIGSDLPPDLLASLYELQQSAGIMRSQYQALLTRVKDLEAQAYLQVADSRLVSEAVPPAHPAGPGPVLLLLPWLLIALLLGVFAALLRDRFIGGFTAPAQVGALLRLPVVAVVPRLRPPRHRSAEDDASTSLADAMIEAPLSNFAEAVRRLRAGIDRSARRQATETGTVVMLASCAKGEGKTTLALALARAYALSGKRTLLIDGDLRQPSLHHALGLEVDGGLLDYLRGGDTDLAAVLARDPQSPAQVALGGHRSDTATDQLISGPAFSRLVASAARSFDVVIIDTPPLGPVVDGLYLAPFANVIALVIRWASTPKAQVREILRDLQAAAPGGEILAVLNQEGAGPPARRVDTGYYVEA